MARGNFREYLRGDDVLRKKYFYLLRPLLAIRWIEKELGPVPIEFAHLVDVTVEDDSLRKAIEKLVEEKKAGIELGRRPRMSPFLDDRLQDIPGMVLPGWMTIFYASIQGRAVRLDTGRGLPRSQGPLPTELKILGSRWRRHTRNGGSENEAVV